MSKLEQKWSGSREKRKKYNKKIGERIKNSLGREKGNCSTTLKKKKKEEGEANGFNLIAEKNLKPNFDILVRVQGFHFKS